VGRGPPSVSHSTVITLIGVCVTAGVVLLAILITAFICCRRLRKRRLALEEKSDTPRSPVPSFIQYPPMLVGASDTTYDARSTLYSPTSMSKAIPEEGHVEGAIEWPGTHVRPKLSQESGLRGSSLRTSTASHVREGSGLSGMTVVNMSLENTAAEESPKSASWSPTLKSSVLPSVIEESLATQPPPRSLVPPPATVTEPSPESRRGRTQRPTPSVADSETMSLRSASKTRSTSDDFVILPPKDNSLPPSRAFHMYPGLPSSPVASLALSRMTLEKDEIPPVPRNPYTSSAFLDSPPRKRSRQGSHSRHHARSLSQSSISTRLATGHVDFKKDSSETQNSQSKYASVAYARAKALELALPRSKSALASVQTSTTPSSQADAPPATPGSSGRTPMATQMPKPDKELLALLSSRPRTRPRSHSWSTGGDAPEMI
jgi:hypothetical protein